MLRRSTGIAQVVPASGERSSYHARNAGAAAARWRVVPVHGRRLHAREPDILDAYFAEPLAAMAPAPSPGRSWARRTRRALAARYARDRKVLSQTDGLYGRGRTIAATGNLLVRRAAFDELGGFVEGIRSAGDVDFCLRLQDGGLGAGLPPERVRPPPPPRERRGPAAHLRPLRLGVALAQRALPGDFGRWPLSPVELGRAGTDAVRLAVSGDREQATFRLIDGAGLVAHNVGWRLPNTAG